MKNPTPLSLKPELSGPVEAGGIAMLFAILLGCLTSFDLFALLVFCFTVSVENVDPVTVSEAEEPRGGSAESWKVRELKCLAMEVVLSLPTTPLPWMSLRRLTAGPLSTDSGSGRSLTSTLLNAN